MTSPIDDRVRTFLAEPRFAVLATINSDGTPQLTTMWYELQDDTLMMNTRVGRVKDRNLRRDPRISVCIEDGYRYVTLYGIATLDDDQSAAHADIRRLAERYQDAANVERMVRDQFSREQRVTIRMKIERVDASL